MTPIHEGRARLSPEQTTAFVLWGRRARVFGSEDEARRVWDLQRDALLARFGAMRLQAFWDYTPGIPDQLRRPSGSAEFDPRRPGGHDARRRHEDARAAWLAEHHPALASR